MRIYANILFLIAALAFTAVLCAQTANPATLYNEGNSAYRNKDWTVAIEKYLTATDAGISSPELYYNLGCAYFRAGDVGRAILWLERARLLSPRDVDIKKNLIFMQKMTQDKVESVYRGTPLTWFWKAIEGISFSEFWWLLLILSACATVATIYSILQLRGWWLPIVLWIAFAIFSCGWYTKGNRTWERNLGIVVAPKIDIKSAPAEDSELLFTLHGGTRVGILDERLGWHKITIEDGHTGWVNADAIEPVIKNLE